jgi:hypothetical protein
MRKTLTSSLILFLAASFILIISCERTDPDAPQDVMLDRLTGLVQKGPYINGTPVDVAELTPDLIQTGKNFNTQISDNRGSFELKQIELSSQFVELKADGFYYNEITGDPSTARLVLYALSNLTDRNTLNVNLISHLERDRVYQLISEGASFGDAKEQAQREVLEIFSIEKTHMGESESLNITSQGDDHAILLAISVILQGHRSVAELSELLANINSDLKEDGELNSSSLGSSLINHAIRLNTSSIRENLETRYEETGLDVELPDFEKYILAFIENTPYEITSTFEYPEFSPYGENILYPELTTVIGNRDYSLAADLPSGSHVKVRLSGGMWWYRAMPEGPKNWTVSQYDSGSNTQLFISTAPGELSDLSIHFAPPSTQVDSSTMQDSLFNKEILIQCYENLSDTVTWSKKLEILPRE